MKTPLLAFFLGTAVAVSLRAQEPALPSPTPSAPSAPAGSPTPAPMTLTPLTPETPPLETQPVPGPMIPPLPPEPQIPQPRKSTTVTSEQDLKLRIRFREAKTLALKDLGVQEQWARSRAATTDPQKREALREYYTRLYARMLKIDGSLAATIEEHRTAALARLSQGNIAPAPPPGEESAGEEQQ